MYNYKSTGVDISRADEIIKNISSKFGAKNFENFAGVFKNPLFKDYSFVSCTDGIGTKIIPLIQKNDPKTIANDLVAMNLNDLITLGAKPLFFLDYIAASDLKTDLIQNTIENLKEILLNYNCALLGGEISQMRDIISPGFFDIAGFLVGCCKNSDFLDKNNTKKGDIIVGFASSGIHANGFSLIRKLYEDKKIDDEMFQKTLNPTKIYFDLIEILNSKKLIKSAANITGGGIYQNTLRSIKQGLNIKLDYNSIPKQEIFEVIKKYTDFCEAQRIFNLGCGFCVICDKNNTDEILKLSFNWNPFVLGEVIE